MHLYFTSLVLMSYKRHPSCQTRQQCQDVFVYQDISMLRSYVMVRSCLHGGYHQMCVGSIFGLILMSVSEKCKCKKKFNVLDTFFNKYVLFYDVLFCFIPIVIVRGSSADVLFVAVLLRNITIIDFFQVVAVSSQALSVRCLLGRHRRCHVFC